MRYSTARDLRRCAHEHIIMSRTGHDMAFVNKLHAIIEYAKERHLYLRPRSITILINAILTSASS